ncbi:hypothetical protein J6590_048940 [Homalodisca vitripennis]|nr:hypothetical protein J6590_048940 [Homalodisca vitripennis]
MYKPTYCSRLRQHALAVVFCNSHHDTTQKLKMAGLVKMAIDRYVNLVDSISDPRVNDWPLMSSPIPTVAMVAAYLYVVIFLGPRVMANRKPFKLNNILIVYNAAQVIFSLVMLWEALCARFESDWIFREVKVRDSGRLLSISSRFLGSNLSRVSLEEVVASSVPASPVKTGRGGSLSCLG